MAKTAKQQSNPCSTGGGGTNFETRVQAAFTVLMLTGRLAPCIPPFPIAKIKLQGRYAGFNTDDCIIFTEHPQTKQEARLFAQIKHEISITKSDDTFAEVIQSMWNDFNDKNFDSNTNALVLITGILSAVDINDVRPILEWARHSENEKEFLSKVRTENFSSDKKRDKLEAFQKHLKDANDGRNVSDRELWEFLKVFHLIGYDLDTESGITLSLLHSLIALFSNETAPLIWSRVVDFVQLANQNAGTITLETIPEDIRNVFNTVMFSDLSSDVKRLKKHGQIVLEKLKIDVGGIHIRRSDILSKLVNVTETSNFVFVSGERGSGKSSLIREFSDTIDQNIPLFCLRIEDLDRAHLDNVFSSIGLKGSLSDLETGFALIPKKYLIIESLEKLLELENTTAFTDLLHWLNHQKNWTVIATGRDYAYQQIIFNYLQPFEVNFKTLQLKSFSDRQVQSLCEQLEPLQNFANNPKLKSLLKSPFYANFAYRVMTTGTIFSSEDGEKEFRIAVWKEIIAKEKERKNGMPIKRKNTFIDIAVSRAKQMVYGVSSVNFDEETILKLEEDNLISRNYNDDLVSPAHDILEDWALEKYIEDAYKQYSHEIQFFLNEIGHEPAINRAFRLWLHQKLIYGENVEHFICSILDNQNVQRYWQDEAIAAVLQGENPNEFLKLLQERLFSNNGDLLKRFCFILRIACQAPNSQITSESQTKDEKTLVDTLYFKPYGKGWQSLICFCFENKDRITKNLEPHIIAVLDSWSSVLNLNDELPIPAREVGLLALHLLNDLKDSYNDKSDRQKLLSIIIQTISVIHEEFIELLETDIFSTKGQNRRPRYIKDFCKMSFEGVESAFFCKHDPDRLIKLAYLEWLIEESEESNLLQGWSYIEGTERFGLHEYPYQFFPASGARGPFHLLLRFHTKKGLDFVITLLNLTVERYIKVCSSSPRYHSSEQEEIPELIPIELNIKLNNGETISQSYCKHFWLAYRGYSTVPYLLQCALMALENWLIAYTKNCSEPNELELLFNYILRKSNSVMPTAVLASVATGFPEKVGKSAMPLLQTPELYRMDINRIIQERGKHETDWHNSGFKREELSKIYSEERRIAALRPWRGKHLEKLLVRLQFSEWENEAFSVVDTLRSIKPQDDTLRFLLHRVDSRTWKPIVDDEENNRIIFKSENLEPDLEEIQQNTLTTMQKQNRISTIWVWATKTFKREPLEKEYYSTWRDAFTEAQTLLKQLKDETENNLANLRNMELGSIVTAAAIFLRDHYSELTEEEVSWCAELIAELIGISTDTENLMIANDLMDFTGLAAASSVLPIFFDFISEEEKLIICNLIAGSITHINTNIRHKIAEGIKEYLWQRDPEFAQQCVLGALEYARFQKETKSERIKLAVLSQQIHFSFSNEDRARYTLEKEAEEAKLNAKINEFRSKLARGEFPHDYQKIDFETHDPNYVLSPCLMIPNGSRETIFIEFFSNILTFFFKAEQEEKQSNGTTDDERTMNYKIPLDFAKCFAQHLFLLHNSNFSDYIEQLKVGCKIAPSFTFSIILYVAVEAEQVKQTAIYWQLCKELSPTVQKIAIEIAQRDSDHRHRDETYKLIRGILRTDVEWQEIDSENQDMILGKELILEFVANAGENPDVFDALARLIYYFPSIFFDLGIHILAKHQKEEGGIRLFSGINTAFYLERAIQHFLHLKQTGALSRQMHESCLILLDVIIETASSRAYYLREHLIRSRKIQ